MELHQTHDKLFVDLLKQALETGVAGSPEGPGFILIDHYSPRQHVGRLYRKFGLDIERRQFPSKDAELECSVAIRLENVASNLLRLEARFEVFREPHEVEKEEKYFFTTFVTGNEETITQLTLAILMFLGHGAVPSEKLQFILRAPRAMWEGKYPQPMGE